MEPLELRDALEKVGLQLLGVGRNSQHDDVLMVYLHGNAGQWSEGSAVETIKSIDGVLSVAESVNSPTIILVRVTQNMHG
jgi:hypothetical protein